MTTRTKRTAEEIKREMAERIAKRDAEFKEADAKIKNMETLTIKEMELIADDSKEFLVLKELFFRIKKDEKIESIKKIELITYIYINNNLNLKNKTLKKLIINFIKKLFNGNKTETIFNSFNFICLLTKEAETKEEINLIIGYFRIIKEIYSNFLTDEEKSFLINNMANNKAIINDIKELKLKAEEEEYYNTDMDLDDVYFEEDDVIFSIFEFVYIFKDEEIKEMDDYLNNF